ncbi:MAG: hypothetical protein VKK42_23770 [Lyngbya sp.]|nr:hypothetical protein [Lyngbya sp.]
MARVDFCQLPGWQYEAGESTITMIAPDINTAEDYLFNLRQNPQKFIRWQEPVEIYVKYAEGTHRYRVPITNSVGKPKEESDTSEMKTETQINPITLTPDADYQRVSEWLIEKWNEGKSVCVTSQIDLIPNLLFFMVIILLYTPMCGSALYCGLVCKLPSA